MNIIKLSFRMLRRDWRAGELRVLAFALVIAVGGMTTVGFFADRVQLALSRQGNQLLGADLIIFADHPLPTHYADEARRLGLAVSTAIKFPSMAAKGETSLLTEIKAVTAGYRLPGLRISPMQFPHPDRRGWMKNS
jgi:putative ABC transport system permease protein